MEQADGDIITDADGNRYIDFLTSASSLNLGSRNPEVMAAALEQLGKCTQFTAAYSYNKPMIEYAEEPGPPLPGGEAKVCFGNCGSDANDAAVKFCGPTPVARRSLPSSIPITAILTVPLPCPPAPPG